MSPEKVKALIMCPGCGISIRITGEAEEVEVFGDVRVDDVLNLFTPAVRKDMRVNIEGNHAILELGGKYNRSKFSKARAEVIGYGGRWVKGHFILPLAGLGEKE